MQLSTSIARRLVLILVLVLNAGILSAQSVHTISRKIPLMGNEGWDYMAVDENTNRLFVSHGSIVQVVDLDKGRVMDSIGDLKGVHGIAFAASLNKGFITNGRGNSVTVFGLTDLKVQATIALKAENPDAIVFDPASQKVFVMNGRSSSATVINAATNEIVKDIPLEGKPEFAVADAKGYVYVNIEDKADICVINTRTLAVEKTFSLAPGENPSGLAMDIFGSRLFAVCSNQLMIVMDSHNGKIVAKVPIGERPDAVVFDPVQSQIFCSNGNGTMTIVDAVDPSTYKISQTMATRLGARTCALNNKTHAVYTGSADLITGTSSPENPHPRPTAKPNSFMVLEIVQKK